MSDWDLYAQRGATGLINGAELGHAQCTSLVTTVAAVSLSTYPYGDDVPGLITDVTTSDRPVLVVVTGLCFNDTNSNGGYVLLLEDSVLVDFTTQLSAPGVSGSAGIGSRCHMTTRRNPAPGAHEYKVQFAHWTSGTFKINGSATSPALLEVFEV